VAAKGATHVRHVVTERVSQGIRRRRIGAWMRNEIGQYSALPMFAGSSWSRQF